MFLKGNSSMYGKTIGNENLLVIMLIIYIYATPDMLPYFLNG